MTGNRYFLRSEVYFCVSDNNVVFRDIRTDTYLAVPITITAAFPTSVVGWPSNIECGRIEGQASIEDSYDALEEMLSQGLLTKNRCEGKIATPFDWPAAVSSLCDDDTRISKASQIWHFPCFLKAARAAAKKLRARVLDPEIGPWIITPELIESVRVRKLRDTKEWNPEKAQRLTRVARELRPWFNEKPVCTLDSLIIIEFFARHALHPDWIFGVQANPPDAHCWVQYDDELVNDTVDVVSQFAPIMAV